MKKLIALLLALVMVFALAACSTTNEPAKENNNETSTDGKLYIPVMAKGFQHQFWQAVKTGAEAAAKDYDVEIYFDGPASETEIDAQVNMVKTEMAKNPKAMALAAERAEKYLKRRSADMKIGLMMFSAPPRTSPSSASTPAFPATPPALSRRPPAPTTRALPPSLRKSSTRTRLSLRR